MYSVIDTRNSKKKIKKSRPGKKHNAHYSLFRFQKNHYYRNNIIYENSRAPAAVSTAVFRV